MWSDSETSIFHWNRHVLSYYTRTHLRQARFRVNVEPPVDIVDMCGIEYSGQKHVLFATEEGSIYRIQMQENLLKSSASKGSQSLESSTSNGDIFKELLVEETDEDLVLPSSSSVVTVAQDCRVHQIEGVACIRAVNNIVIIITHRFWSYHIHFFLQQDLMKPEKVLVAVTPIFVESLRAIPTGQNHLSDKVNCYVIYPESSQSVLTEAGVTVSSALYSQLFGMDLNMCNAPVVLLCLPSGHVYAVPTKGQSGHDYKITKHCWLLYDLGEAVTSVCFVERDKGSEEDGRESALLLIGCCGKVVSVQPGENGMPTFTEHVIPGPVVCCCVHKGNLIFSTYKDTFMVSVKDICVSSCKRLPYWGITGLACINSQGEETSVVGVRLKGQLLPISLCTQTRHKIQPENRQSVRELLPRIDSMYEKSKEWQVLQREQTSILSQLNLAAHIVTGLSSVLTCDIRAKNCDSGLFVQHKVECTLRNQSNLVMHRGWSFIVMVKSENQRSDVPLDTKAVSLNEFVKCGFVTLTLKFCDQFLNWLPLTVSPCLIYEVPNVEVLSKQVNLKKSVSNLKEKTITVPLPEVSLDIVHFMQNCSLLPSFKSRLHGRDCEWHHILKCMAGNRPFSHDCATHVGSYFSQNHSNTLTVPRSELNQLLDGNESPITKGSECMQLLWHLLRDSNIDLKTIDQPQVGFVTPDCHTGTLTVQETEESGTERYQVTIQTTDLPTLCKMRAALLVRLQNKGPIIGQAGVPTAELRKILFKIQDIKDKLLSLMDVMSEAKRWEQAEEQIISVYKRIRDLNLPS
ncbi:uncharacterized protein LOC106169104 [Lingula anatina]|uniref:Uncharacterized protein LOC106169104 n=1 Tax=Lingula anatina TaxID=7574 RepID=A0A1S3J0X4_LINAN|nr:uncharacterized protein LOC106169104 [Lingula anatina]|eukprot:XP_013403913.1 uncharacterized protein LOC106169104 [Lingula anatina]